MTDRRHFLELAAATTTGLALGCLPARASAAGVLPGRVADVAPAPEPQAYAVRDGAVLTRPGRGYFNNRPLYGANDGTFVLAGDQPLVRLGRDGYLHGALLLAFAPAGRQALWLHELAGVEASCRDGVAGWVVQDARWPGIVLQVETVPLADAAGFALRVRVEGARQGDRLVWAYGGVHRTNGRAAHARDVCGHPELLQQGFAARECAGNAVAGADGIFRVGVDKVGVAGRWSAPDGMALADASALADPLALAGSTPAALPLAAGRFGADALRALHLVVVVAVPGEPAAVPEPEGAFAAAVAHRRGIAGRFALSTPDPHVDALGPMAALAVDGLWRPPVFVHGAMLWSVPLLGWRTLFGATVLGWHERVAAQAAHYLPKQVTASTKTAAKTDPARQHSQQHPDSRLYGAGRIDADQKRYDMQSQFFDQLVHAWRATGDAAFAARLRPALELHLDWLRACFDPDEDGLYESYLNAWPTDSVWYNGGGSVEATVYAWRGHAAARDMARLAGDTAAVARHQAMLDRIRAGFFGRLWNDRGGHPGAYLEQGGHRRRHDDPWLYSLFLPVDAASEGAVLLSPKQAVQALHHAKSTLENRPMPLGGRTVVTSNWVPGIWSVRENWPGDNYHLALAYFQAGLADDGWDILRGTCRESAFNGDVPGNLGGRQGGTDFGDCVHMFCRAVVEGLFGWRPDYPNGRVLVAPQLPAGWPEASLRTPDVAVRVVRAPARLALDVTLARPAPLTVRLPVRGRPAAVRANGRAAPFRVVAGCGQSLVELDLPALDKVAVTVELAMPAVAVAPMHVAGRVGRPVRLVVPGARILAVDDPEGVLASHAIAGDAVLATLAGNPGHHTVFVDVEEHGAPAWRVFHLHVDDPAAARALRAATVARLPARPTWATIALGEARNGDIRTIFRQEYLSPRPATVSLRIGSDGYSPWTFTHWNVGPPEIRLDGIDRLRDGADRIRTPQGVPFAWPAGHNVAFASLWDNWPDRVSVPVDRAGEAVFFLVAGSTNVMQCHIANAVLRLRYADGQEDSLELVPPRNYWNLCPIVIRGNSVEQGSRSDYTDPADAFAVPKPWPETVQLGENCRAMLLNRRLRRGVRLASVTLEALSQEVVVGLMGIAVLGPA